MHTPVEELMASIWKEILDREHIERDDNFFDLGGHSLLATQIAARVQDMLHLEISVRMLFDAPTIAGMAEQIEEVARQVTIQHRPLTRWA